MLLAPSELGTTDAWGGTMTSGGGSGMSMHQYHAVSDAASEVHWHPKPGRCQVGRSGRAMAACQASPRDRAFRTWRQVVGVASAA